MYLFLQTGLEDRNKNRLRDLQGDPQENEQIRPIPLCLLYLLHSDMLLKQAKDNRQNNVYELPFRQAGATSVVHRLPGTASKRKAGYVYGPGEGQYVSRPMRPEVDP